MLFGGRGGASVRLLYPVECARVEAFYLARQLDLSPGEIDNLPAASVDALHIMLGEWNEASK